MDHHRRRCLGAHGARSSIAVDAADRPHIVYHTWNGQNLKYATPTHPRPTGPWHFASTGDLGEETPSSSIRVVSCMCRSTTQQPVTWSTCRNPQGLSITDEVTVEFGQLGAVTGDVVNDTTIRPTTPSVASAGVVNLRLVDDNGDEHLLSLPRAHRSERP